MKMEMGIKEDSCFLFFAKRNRIFILYKHRTDQSLNALQRAPTHKCICVYLKRKGDKAD